MTDIAGTTRDILEEQINLDGVILNVIDTAGIRETHDVVEKIGVDRTKEYLLSADLIIYVVDSSTDFDENDTKILPFLKEKKAVILLNKSDLNQNTSEEDLYGILKSEKLNHPVISISAKERLGIQDLKDKVKEMFFTGDISFNDEIFITNIRQKSSLQSALDSLSLVEKSIEEGMPEDFYSIDLMNAYEELGAVTGETAGEDLINEIFSSFCMGK